MKKALLFIFFLSTAFFSKFLPSTSLVYSEIEGDNKWETTYHISENDGKRIIESESPKEKYSLTYSLSYQLEKISFSSKANDDHYDVSSDGSTLTYDGKINREQKNKSFSIQGKLWIQNFPFGLIPFASSSQTSRTFFVLNTKELVLYQMRAKKMGVSTLTLGDKPYKVEKIEVRLPGFKSLFWKAELWFDVESHQMIRYQTNEGPNTPTTTLEFVSKHASL